MQWPGMSQPRAVAGVSATARRHIPSAEGRAFSMAALEGGDVASAPRRPSPRPINARWDRSRGIVFATPTRPARDLTWSPRDGVAFSTTSRVERRALSGSQPSSSGVQPPSGGTPRPSLDFGVGGRSIRPPPPGSPRPGGLAPVNRTGRDPEPSSPYEARINMTRADIERELDIVQRQLKGLESDIKQKENRIKQVEGERDREKAERAHENERQARKQAEADAQIQQARAETERIAVKAEQDHEAEAQRRLERKEAELIKVNASLVVERAKARLEADREKQRREEAREMGRLALAEQARDHQAQLRAAQEEAAQNYQNGRGRIEERKSYNAYKAKWNECTAAIQGLKAPMIELEDMHEKAASKHREETSYTLRLSEKVGSIKDLDRHRGLLARLDESLFQGSRQAETERKAIRDLRFTLDDLRVKLAGLGHETRALTQFHHLNPQSEWKAAELANKVGNEWHFRNIVEESDGKLDQLKEQLRKEVDAEAKDALRQDFAHYEAISRFARRNLDLHIALRSRDMLKALLADSLAEKEAYLGTIDHEENLNNSKGSYRSAAGDREMDSDGDVPSWQEKRAQSANFAAKESEIRSDLEKLRQLIRKKTMLLEKRGEVSASRVVELDEQIQMRIRRADTRFSDALARLGINLKNAEGRATLRRTAFKKPVTPSVAVSRAKMIAKVPKPNVRRPELKTAPPAGPQPAPSESGSVSEARQATSSAKKTVFDITRPLPKDWALHPGEHKQCEMELRGLRRTLARPLSAKAKTDGEIRMLNARVRLARHSALQSQRSWDTLSKSNPDDEKLEKCRRDFCTHMSVASRALSIRQAASRKREPRQSSDVRSSVEIAQGFKSFKFVQASAQAKAPVEYWPETRSANGMGYLFKAGDYERFGLASSSQKREETAKPSNDDGQTEPLSPVRPLPKAEVTGAEPESGHADRRVTPLRFNISAEDYRAAVTASPSTGAAYWSYAMYKDPAGQRPSVRYCRNMEAAERELQHFVGQPVLGFDIEWEPGASKKSSIKANVSLIQLACEDRICLIHTAQFRGDAPEDLMPPTLQSILGSENVVKAGVNISGDATRIERHLGVRMVGQFELAHLYKVVTSPAAQVNKSLKGAGLAAQVQSVLLLPLKKDDVRVSQWSRPLSKEQADYSASDAYAGFRLFHALEVKRLAMVPTPPRPAFRELNKPIVLGDGTVVRSRPRKPPVTTVDGKAPEELDDEPEEEYFDALETQDTYGVNGWKVAGVPLSGVGVTYPTLPERDAIVSGLDENDIPAQPEHAAAIEAGDNSRTAPSPAAATPSPFVSPEMARADAWAASWKSSLPIGYNLKASTPSLRAYHVWHEQGHDIRQVAALARSPPLAPQTVATYVLEAIKHEDLPFEMERAREVLRVLPGAVHGRYRKVLKGGDA